MITAQEKLDCVARELKLRKLVYTRMVTSGRMTQRLADKEIALMTAIVEDYQALAQGERLL